VVSAADGQGMRVSFSPRATGPCCGFAEAQIDALSDAEVDTLLEIYEVLRLTPDNGRMLR
jgi:hypothetical protein